MNTFHRFLVAGFLFYASGAWAVQPYPEQQTYQQPNYAQQQPPKPRSYGENIGRKALNAAINIPTAPLEIPKSMINIYNGENSNFFYSIFGGAIEGSLYTAVRLGAGILDLTTFLIPTKPIVQPQFVWQDFDEKTTYGNVFRLDTRGNPQTVHFELPRANTR